MHESLDRLSVLKICIIFPLCKTEHNFAAVKLSLKSIGVKRLPIILVVNW